MPSPAPYPPTQNQTPPFPALFLYPLNDSFVPKHISLQGGQHVKIGRQTNAKTIPGERNGYFDSKVLSRQHAEVWEENGKIYIKDVKSSNGTFINADRLSNEGLESKPFELKNDDIVEFGIDIVGEDNKTIIHHKVAARVSCILTAEEAAVAAREAHNYQQQQMQAVAAGPSSLNGAQRRPSLQHQANGLSGIGGLGGGMRPPGKSSGLTFDHIVSRIQGELNKSRDVSTELNNVTGSINEIGEILSGQSGNVPPYPNVLPPVRPASQHPPQPPQPAEHEPSPALQSLQTQLAETQASLAGYVEKIHLLETLLNEQEGLKREVHEIKHIIEERERQQVMHESMQEQDLDDDDNRSIQTLVAHELESVPEEDEPEAEESDEDRNARGTELGRPKTPEPSSMGMREDEYEHEEHHTDREPNEPSSPAVPAISEELNHRLATLTDQLDSALELSRNLMSQHSTAQETINLLEGKVAALEDLVRTHQSQKEDEYAKKEEQQSLLEKERQSNMTSLFAEFQKTFESRWESVKQEWVAEREKWDRTRGEWDTRVKHIEDGFSSTTGKFELELASLKSHQTTTTGNGHAVRSGGLVTPPSPRSLSSDSDKPRRRKPSRRSRSRSRSPSSTLVNDDANLSSSQASMHSRSSSSSNAPVRKDTDDSINGPMPYPPTQFPLTPGASILEEKPLKAVGVESMTMPGSNAMQSDDAVSKRSGFATPVNNTQVAVGVLVLSVAAAAVLWRVKE